MANARRGEPSGLLNRLQPHAPDSNQPDGDRISIARLDLCQNAECHDREEAMGGIARMAMPYLKTYRVALETGMSSMTPISEWPPRHSPIFTAQHGLKIGAVVHTPRPAHRATCKLPGARITQQTGNPACAGGFGAAS